MIAFLRGFIQGDGTKEKGFVKDKDAYRIELASEWLIRDLKILCDYAGCYSGRVRTRERLNKPPSSKEPRVWRTTSLYVRFDEKLPKMSQVRSVKEVGKEHVYDIMVPPYFNFILNGIIVHNSMATPHVAGLMALLAEAVPEITIDAVKRVISGVTEKSINYGYGLIRLSMFRW